MKFWDHQHNARSETRRLLLGFAFAVVVLVAAVHAALALAWWLMVAGNLKQKRNASWVMACQRSTVCGEGRAYNVVLPSMQLK